MQNTALNPAALAALDNVQVAPDATVTATATAPVTDATPSNGPPAGTVEKKKIVIGKKPTDDKKQIGRPAAKRTTATPFVIIPAASLPELLGKAKSLGSVVLEGSPIMTPQAEIEEVTAFYLEKGFYKDENGNPAVPANVLAGFEIPRDYETLTVAELAARGNSDARIAMSDIRAAFERAMKAAFAVAQTFDPEVAAFIAAEEEKKAAAGAALAAKKEAAAALGEEETGETETDAAAPITATAPVTSALDVEEEEV